MVHKKKFPQISRIISASKRLVERKEQFSLVLILAGLFFFLVLNLLVVIAQPPLLKSLQQNPQDSQTLIKVLEQTNDADLEIYLKNELQSLGELAKVKEVEAQQIEKANLLRKLAVILRDNPQYPDGYAYQAVLYYEQRNCKSAKKSLSRALRLDPHRPVFQKIAAVIKKCE